MLLITLFGRRLNAKLLRGDNNMSFFALSIHFLRDLVESTSDSPSNITIETASAASTLRYYAGGYQKVGCL